MFLRHARATRLAAAYLLFFTVSLLIVPKADIPETLFDESNTPTNEIVVRNPASLENRELVTSFVPRMFAQVRKLRAILPIYAARLTDSRTFRELFCTLLR
jgi:hypothetical protein